MHTHMYTYILVHTYIHTYIRSRQVARFSETHLGRSQPLREAGAPRSRRKFHIRRSKTKQPCGHAAASFIHMRFCVTAPAVLNQQMSSCFCKMLSLRITTVIWMMMREHPPKSDDRQSMGCCNSCRSWPSACFHVARPKYYL